MCCDDSGVGLTGIVISGLCQTKSVHLTDYTEASLVNMEHNVKVNTKWMKNARNEMMDTSFNEGQPVTSVSSHIQSSQCTMQDDKFKFGTILM